MENKNEQPLICIAMGSESDLKIMLGAIYFLKEHNIPYEVRILSAHRTPYRALEYAELAREKGIKIIIAGAGGAAHLPGMMAAVTVCPVIGVPIQQDSNTIQGDSLLAIVQMPGGVPVATVAVNQSKNAAILAMQILAVSDNSIAEILLRFKEQIHNDVVEIDKKIFEEYSSK